MGDFLGLPTSTISSVVGMGSRQNEGDPSARPAQPLGLSRTSTGTDSGAGSVSRGGRCGELWCRNRIASPPSRRRERRNVRQIDDHMLRDIGLDRFTAEQVGARPFWTA